MVLFSPAKRVTDIQSPIIPVVAGWLQQCPGALSLGQGVVGYGPPREAMHALNDGGWQVHDHLYGAVAGEGALIAQITEKLAEDNAIRVSLGFRVVVTAGSNMGFLNALMAITNPGDEVILPMPYYFNQEMAIRMVGCTPVPVPTDRDYQPDLEAMAAAITPKTRAIVTVSPNNPTGAVYPEPLLRAVNGLCQGAGLFHISDEAYEYFTWAAVPHFSPASIEGAERHTISLYSLSKSFGMAAWRVGYMVVPESLYGSILKIQDTNLICPPRASQRLALKALERGREYPGRHRGVIGDAREVLMQHLSSVKGGVELPTADGAFYLFLRVNTKRSSLNLAQALVEKHGVAVIPGEAFGPSEECYIRISYGSLTPELARIGGQRLLDGLTSLV